MSPFDVDYLTIRIPRLELRISRPRPFSPRKLGSSTYCIDYLCFIERITMKASNGRDSIVLISIAMENVTTRRCGPKMVSVEGHKVHDPSQETRNGKRIAADLAAVGWSKSQEPWGKNPLYCPLEARCRTTCIVPVLSLSITHRHRHQPSRHTTTTYTATTPSRTRLKDGRNHDETDRVKTRRFTGRERGPHHDRDNITRLKQHHTTETHHLIDEITSHPR